jgi:hypothetical protein
VHHFTPQTKQTGMQWKNPTSPTAKKFELRHSAGKVTAPVFWDTKGVIGVEFMSRGTTQQSTRKRTAIHWYVCVRLFTGRDPETCRQV